MPQMSPMTWILLSFMFMTFYYLTKLNSNLNFNSKLSEKKTIMKNILNISW